jgi:hypothetical protein
MLLVQGPQFENHGLTQSGILRWRNSHHISTSLCCGFSSIWHFMHLHVTFLALLCLKVKRDRRAREKMCVWGGLSPMLAEAACVSSVSESAVDMGCR